MQRVPSLKLTTVERCARYYNFLINSSNVGANDTVSSSELAACAGVDDSQVRKDLASIGVKGTPRVGSKAADIIEAIERALAYDCHHRAVVVGLGRLGSALACYPGFGRCGFSIVGLFDSSADRVGTELNGTVIQDISNLEWVIKRRKACVTAITTPAVAAQEIADRSVAAGIKAIWNFSPTTLVVPEDVVLRNENLSVGLAVILAQLAEPGNGRNGTRKSPKSTA